MCPSADEYNGVVGAQETYCPNPVLACQLSASKFMVMKKNSSNY